MQHFSLQLKYGVVRYRGTTRHNSGHDLMFQTDHWKEAMNELERFAQLNEPEYTYMLTVNNNAGHEKRQYTADHPLQDRRKNVRTGSDRRRNQRGA
jgi:hypothetical protein